MALHRLGPVLFSTNIADQINFLQSRAFYELSKIVLPVGSSWSGKAGQLVVISLHGGVHFVTPGSQSGTSHTFPNLSLPYKHGCN